MATVPPVNRTPAVASHTAMLPSVCPGVAMTCAPPPNSMVSPSANSVSTGQGDARWSGGDPLIQRPLGGGENRIGTHPFAADDPGVLMVRQHLDVAPAAYRGS